jgi:FdhD protein
MPTSPAVERWPTTFIVDESRHQMPDPVVVEEPLEIWLAGPGGENPSRLAVTLRSPGHDPELAAGLLYAEGIVDTAADIAAVVAPTGAHEGASVGRLEVRLAAASPLSGGAGRPFLSTSACGACGKEALDLAFATGFPPLPPGPRLTAALLQSLPERMREAQVVFARTGGLHAAGLFSPAGELLVLREDVGRHNAVDKVVGSLLLAGRLPAGETVLAVSGRAGFELVQKALRAGIPALAAVGAPSSLALRLAARAGMTLAGFVRPGRCNLYSGAERVA